MLEFSLAYHPKSEDDPLMSLSEQVAKNAALILTTGKFWVEFFPIGDTFLG